MRAVTDAGPLIHLSWIGQLGLLTVLFSDVVSPPAVFAEVLAGDTSAHGLEDIRAMFFAGLVRVEAVRDQGAVNDLAVRLGRGEAEALTLTRQIKADLLLVDDRRARALGVSEGLAITGTIGILRMARERGLIARVAPLLEELRTEGFWISDELVHAIQREEAGDV